MILFCTVSCPPLLRLIHPNIVKLKEAPSCLGFSVVSQSLLGNQILSVKIDAGKQQSWLFFYREDYSPEI